MCQIKMVKSSFSFPLLLLLLSSTVVHSVNVPIPLGIVFGQVTPELQSAFKYALLTFSLNITTNPRDLYRFTAYVDQINTADAFKLSKLICNQFSRGIHAMVGTMNAESFHTYHAFANTFHMPLITPWYPTKDVMQVEGPVTSDSASPSPYGQGQGHRGQGKFGSSDYATRLRPDFNPAILETIRLYGWKDIIYLYSTNEGLLRLQTLFYRQNLDKNSLRLKAVKKIQSAKDAIGILKEIEGADRYGPKYVLLDAPTALAKEVIVSHVRDVQLGRRTYHYLLAGLAFDDDWEREVLEFQAVNVTSFRMVDPERRYVQDFFHKWSSLDTMQYAGAGKKSISANAALMYDAMLILKEAFTDILTDNPFAFQRFSPEAVCESGSDFLDDIRPFEYGQNVNQHLRRVQTEGLTGNIQFHENGTRKYFSVDVVELRDNATKVKIAQWTDYSGFKVMDGSKKEKGELKGKTSETLVTVTTNLDEPYLKLKPLSDRKGLEGNEVYEGYMKDFADLLFQKLGMKYRFQLVRDGKYGSKVETSFGENWNGIVGELIRKEVDLAIAPLTITSERIRVIEFSKPFLTQGISIMAYKPRKALPNMFSFMNPFSEWVWLSVLASYFGVSLVFYLIHRLTRTTPSTGSKSQPEGKLSVNVNGDLAGPSNGSKPGESQVFLIQRKRLQDQEKVPLTQFLWMGFQILTSNRAGSSAISKSIAGKFASTVWWLFALIFVSVYTGNFIAIRMRNRAYSPIKSAWDLVDSGGIQYGTLRDGTTYEFFQHSENQVYRAMFEHMSGPNQMNVASYEDGINLVRQKKGKYVFLMESGKIDYISSLRPCNTMRVGYDLAEAHYGIGLPMGSPLTEKLNLAILQLKESGHLRRLEEKWWLNRVECQVAVKLDQLQSMGNEEELSLGSMAGIFYVLIIGMVISLFVSFLEFFCRNKESPPLARNKSPLPKPETLMRNNPQAHRHPQHHHPHCQNHMTLINPVPVPEFCEIGQGISGSSNGK